MPKPPTLTKYEITVLINHTLRDLSYGVGGTYHKAGDTESMNQREATAARRAVEKLRAMLKPEPTAETLKGNRP